MLCVSVEYSFKDITFEIYPEYTTYQIEDYKQIVNDVLIGGYQYQNKVSVCLIDKDGFILTRSKKHLTMWELDTGITSGCVKVFEYKELRILPILCYEICYPESFFNLTDIDLITHHVAYPMKDKDQYKGWLGLQKAFSQHFNCPLVCACGGEKGVFNLTGIIK